MNDPEQIDVTTLRPSARHDSRSAFPILDSMVLPDGTRSQADHQGQTGMSLREYYAAHAPDLPDAVWVAFVRSHEGSQITGGMVADLIADWRFVYADAMIKRGQVDG